MRFSLGMCAISEYRSDADPEMGRTKHPVRLVMAVVEKLELAAFASRSRRAKAYLRMTNMRRAALRIQTWRLAASFG